MALYGALGREDKMAQRISLSGVGIPKLAESLHQSLIRGRPRVVGIAAAFVSTEGVRQLVEILARCGGPECRLIAGTDNAVTHPEALYAARDHAWKIRLGRPGQGIFHPKLLIAGREFSRGGSIKGLCFVYVGSSNLTAGGLGANIECGFIADGEDCLASASNAFAELWRAASPASDTELRDYAARFAERARCRAVSELTDLGVNDTRLVPSQPSDLQTQQPPVSPALRAEFAVAAWAGLQSFTGEYRFQIEFPKSAGKVIHQLVHRHVQGADPIDIYCPDDEITHPMQYKFYVDNSMFRLNVPNDVPGVEWARGHKDGIAIVELGLPGGAPLRLRLLRPGTEAMDIVGRSAVLGTWRRTTTRSYGWY